MRKVREEKNPAAAGETISLSIDSLAFEGWGVGRYGGVVVFVPFTAPGDTVRVRITAKKKNFWYGISEEILSSSPQRTAPRCPVFGVCGGCQWQHLQYPVQIQAKEQILRDHLRKFAPRLRPRIPPFHGAGNPFGYRLRVRMKVRRLGEQCRIGFFQRKTHDLLDVDACVVAHPRINEVLGGLRGFLQKEGKALSHRLHEIEMEVSPASGQCRLLLRVDFPVDPRLIRLLSREVPSAAAVALQSAVENRGAGSPGIREAARGVPEDTQDWESEEGVFSQVNREQNAVLREVVGQYACCTPRDHLLDLYCGDGNLSLPLAARVASVLGIDLDPGAVSSARRLAARQGSKNCQFWNLDALQGVHRLALSGKAFSVIVLDPPRHGCRPLVEPLSRLGARRLVYVSCHPVNLCRDLGLFASYGYEAEEIRGLDMFPQTYHSELVALLTPAQSDLLRPGLS